MFDEPTSLPMRAAIASLLGGLFGIGMILLTHSAQAQTAAPADAQPAPTTIIESRLMRLGEVALQSLRRLEPSVSAGNTGPRGLRLGDSATEPGSGLRWQVARMQGLRSEGDIPRSRDLISLGVQVRF